MGRVEVERLLTHLGIGRSVGPFTQNQGLSAILFLSKDVLNNGVGGLQYVTRAREQVPVVLTRDECRTVLARIDWESGLKARLLYGSGLRLMECVRLRIWDADFGRWQLMLRHGKGGQNRGTVFPAGLLDTRDTQVAQVRLTHERDLERDFGAVY